MTFVFFGSSRICVGSGECAPVPVGDTLDQLYLVIDSCQYIDMNGMSAVSKDTLEV